MNNVVPLKQSEPVSNLRTLNHLCEWIDANIGQPIGWTELIAHSGMDHLELQKQFIVHLKTSPMQWIRWRRIESKKVSMAATMQHQQQLPVRLMVKAH